MIFQKDDGLMKIKIRLLLLSAIAFGMVTFIYAWLVEPNWISVENIEIQSKKFDKQFSGLKIVLISDLHIKKMNNHLERVAEKINSLKPDYIFVAGDCFSLTDSFEPNQQKRFNHELTTIITFIKSLKPSVDLYLVRGNNDFTLYKERSNLYIERLQAEGIKFLANQKTILKKDGENILLAGVDYMEFVEDDVADFWVNLHDGKKVMQSGWSHNNSYSHFFPMEKTSEWKNYTFSGKMKMSEKDGRMGVTFYSQFHDGFDKYYRLRNSSVYPAFYLSPHGTELKGDSLNTGVVPEPNKWYFFKIKMNTETEGTHIFAKVWKENTKEPVSWQAEAMDRSDLAFTSGTVGLWSAKKGDHFFDNLLVKNDFGDTLLWEDFEAVPKGLDPLGWVDYNRNQEAIPLLMKNVPDSIYSILLAHSPDYALFAEPAGVDLVLSGHTHGGQVRLPIIGAPMVQIFLGEEFVQGLNSLGRTQVYTTRGIGTVWMPIRFLCPPEITVINLRPKK